MSKRTDRREAERLARKEAYKQLRQEQVQQPTAVVAEPQVAEPQEDLLARAHAFFQTEEQPPTISGAQLAANRTNAQLSSGPKSSAGKAKSSMNALKHGLTSQTVVLTGEDLADYNGKLEYSIDRCHPVGDEELRLVQSLVDSTWRINRILRLESSVFLKGYTEFENKFDDRPLTERKALIEAEIYLKYEKSLSNLCTQEARLRRCREKDQAELTRLQTMRKREERIAAEAEQAVSEPTRTRLATKVLSKNGFVFSTPQISPEIPPSAAA